MEVFFGMRVAHADCGSSVGGQVGGSGDGARGEAGSVVLSLFSWREAQGAIRAHQDVLHGTKVIVRSAEE